MMIREIFSRQQPDETPYDVAGDVHFHMLNDEGFYRKHYMPCMDKIKSDYNEKVIQGHVMPMIDKCLNHYCNKYNINKLPKDLMNDQEKADLMRKVIDNERNPQEGLDATQISI